MALISKLFKGDPAFEICLVRDSAHITPGAVGAHVSKIHTALFIFDNYSVAPMELSAGLLSAGWSSDESTVSSPMTKLSTPSAEARPVKCLGPESLAAGITS